MQEVEAICDRIIIIDKGKIVADKDKADIYSIISSKRQVISVEFDKSVTGAQLLAIPNVLKVRENGRGQWILEAEDESDIRPAIFSFAVNNNLTVLSLQKEAGNLEEIFRQLTNG
jgi:ABC-2 type transport system ATP-binding protein